MEGLANDSVAYLITQGALGIGCLAEALVIWKLWTALQSCQNGRLEDAKAMLPVIETANKVNVAQAAGMENISRAMDERTAATQLMANSLSAHTMRLESLEREIERRP